MLLRLRQACGHPLLDREMREIAGTVSFARPDAHSVAPRICRDDDVDLPIVLGKTSAEGSEARANELASPLGLAGAASASQKEATLPPDILARVIAGDYQSECSICLDVCLRDEAVFTKCGHLFCMACIAPVYKLANPTCPNCRQKVSKKDEVVGKTIIPESVDDRDDTEDEDGAGTYEASVAEQLVALEQTLEQHRRFFSTVPSSTKVSSFFTAYSVVSFRALRRGRLYSVDEYNRCTSSMSLAYFSCGAERLASRITNPCLVSYFSEKKYSLALLVCGLTTCVLIHHGLPGSDQPAYDDYRRDQKRKSVHQDTGLLAGMTETRDSRVLRVRHARVSDTTSPR